MNIRRTTRSFNVFAAIAASMALVGASAPAAAAATAPGTGWSVTIPLFGFGDLIIGFTGVIILPTSG